MGFLKGVAGASAYATRPGSLKCQFDAFGVGIEVREAAAIENDQVVHVVVKTREGGTQMWSNFLFVNQFVTGNGLRFDVLEARIAQLGKIRRAKGSAINGFER